jgi:hypothetical protein
LFKGWILVDKKQVADDGKIQKIPHPAAICQMGDFSVS